MSFEIINCCTSWNWCSSTRRTPIGKSNATLIKYSNLQYSNLYYCYCYSYFILQEASNIESNINDSIEETEDNMDSFDEDEFSQDDPLPNTNFVFTEVDFIQPTSHITQENARHHSNWMNAWRTINELEGHEVECRNNSDGKIVWKVVREIEDDQFRAIREKENALYRTKYIPVHSTEVEFGDESFSQSFWALWPGTLDEDVKMLEEIMEKENKHRKEKHLRPIRKVTKGEFITFNALMIGSTVFAQSGQNLWNTNEVNKKVRKKLSSNADFGRYMKLWRFKELRAFVPKIMEDITLKSKGDDWWRFKSRLKHFNNNRKQHIYASHNLIFDESMSAYIPR